MQLSMQEHVSARNWQSAYFEAYHSNRPMIRMYARIENADDSGLEKYITPAVCTAHSFSSRSPLEVEPASTLSYLQSTSFATPLILTPFQSHLVVPFVPLLLFAAGVISFLLFE